MNMTVFTAIIPIYIELGSPDLLKKCLHSKTQNANESLQVVIWSGCPKDRYLPQEKKGSANKIKLK